MIIWIFKYIPIVRNTSAMNQGDNYEEDNACCTDEEETKPILA